MYNISRMQEIDAAEEIVKYDENVVVAELLRLLLREDLFQVQFHVIYYQEDTVEWFQRLGAQSLLIWNYDIMKFCRE